MNERIKELAVECTFFTYGVNGELLYDGFNEEKFAELIVKECAGIYSKIENGNSHMGTDNYLESLQKHFGVEE